PSTPWPPGRSPVVSLSSSATRRRLPSLPTRRSSDLVGPDADPRVDRNSSNAPTVTHRSARADALAFPHGRATDRDTRSSCRRARSEEHTSELQSRENLVCRLLLEKKNKRKHRGRDSQ